MTEDAILPHGPAVALEGLHASIERLHEAMSLLLQGGGGARIWIALSEALYWSAAIDDALATSVADYWILRAADPLGNAAGGLTYARNFHTHELLSFGAAEFKAATPTVTVGEPGEASPPLGRGTVFSVQMLWRPLANLPAPSRPQHGRDVMYDRCLAGRPLTEPLDEATRWFARFI